MAHKGKIAILFDVALNVVATILPIALLQLVIFPQMAEKLGSEQNGLMLTLVALITLVSNSLGNVMNNIRLLYQNDYAELGRQGDFNILLLISVIANIIFVAIGTVCYAGTDFISILLTVLASIFWLVRSYVIVHFRIRLNYSGVLLDNIILLAGYFIGYLLFLWIGGWQWIYIVGNLFSIVNVMLRQNMLREPFEKTPLFPRVVKDSGKYTIATGLSTALSYVDKLLLYPLMGGTAVSIYYSATLIGKICSMAISPISSVMLSYLSKMKQFSQQSFRLMLGLSSGFCLFGLFFSVWISRPLLNLLYPEWAEQSMQIIWITSATAMVTILCAVIHPVVLRFCNMNWQIAINGCCILIYVIAGLLLMRSFQLFGFAVAVLISNSVKLLMLLFAYWYQHRKEQHSESEELEIEKNL